MDIRLLTAYFNLDFDFATLEKEPSVKFCIREGLLGKETGDNEAIDRAELALYNIAYNYYFPKVKEAMKHLYPLMGVDHSPEIETEKQTKYLASDFADTIINFHLYAEQLDDTSEFSELFMLCYIISLWTIKEYLDQKGLGYRFPDVFGGQVANIKHGRYDLIPSIIFNEKNVVDPSLALDLFVYKA